MMRFICLTIVVCCALAGLQVAPASAEKRVALVIGNADYRIGPLANPLNDASAVAEAFDRRLKFDKVMLRKNLGAEAFRAALLEFSREAAGAELGVVYFAGHGTEVAGKNFLIPVDASLARANALALEAIPLDAVLAQLDGVRKLRLVILDACRNNLFQLSGAKRSMGRGLVRIEPEGNTLVAFAAKEGTTADDGQGRHSPYTAALLKHIATPGLEINLLFRRVRTDVVAATGGGQQPAEYHSLGDKEIFLVPPLGHATAPPVPVPPSEAQRTWAAVKDSTSIAALEVFRRQYGKDNPVYDRLAEARIEELRKQQTAAAVPPTEGQTNHVYRADGFEAEFSGEVIVTPSQISEQAKALVVRSTKYIQDGGNIKYMVSATLTKFGANFERGVEMGFAAFKCQRFLGQTTLSLPGGLAREMRGTGCEDGFQVYARYYVVGNWFYQVLAQYKADGDERTARRFLQSFKIVGQ